MQSQRTSRFTSFAVLLLFAAALGGCASGSNIRSDYDPDADFGGYTTYNFMEGAGPDGGNYQGFFAQYMIEAISVEMEKRGYTKADDPDLWVNFNAFLQEKTDIRTTPAPMMGGYYGYRRGYYSTWGGYGYATETRVTEYTEGTFNIDIVDNARDRLVWEAVGVGRVSQKDLKNLEEGVKQGVPKYFAHYPFRAGDPHPVVTEQK
jgi:hypothetical protein